MITGSPSTDSRLSVPSSWNEMPPQYWPPMRRAEDVLRLLAGRGGAGCLHARDHEIHAAHIAPEDRQFLHRLLRHGVRDVRLSVLSSGASAVTFTVSPTRARAPAAR